jgi:hypothetical protein
MHNSPTSFIAAAGSGRTFPVVGRQLQVWFDMLLQGPLQQ